MHDPECVALMMKEHKEPVTVLLSVNAGYPKLDMFRMQDDHVVHQREPRDITAWISARWLRP